MSSPPPLDSNIQSTSAAPATSFLNEAVNESKIVVSPSETIFTFLAVGFIGFLFGTVKHSWDARSRGKRSTDSKSCSFGSPSESSNNNSSIRGSISNSASPTVELLHANAPRVVRETNVHCQRCSKILDWEEANKPFRKRLKSPESSEADLISCDLKSGLKKKRKRVSFGPPPRHYRRIVCFGDSNTWGRDPVSRNRLETRWSLVMGEELGNTYKVVEEGLCGRTIDKPDPIRMKDKGFSHSGLEHVASTLTTHKPLDLVIVFLGTNDLKTHLKPSVDSMVRGMLSLINRIKKLDIFPKLTKEQTAFTKTRSQILLMSPPLLTKVNPGSSYGEESVKVSAALTPAFKKLASEQKIHFLDTSEIIQTSELDPAHFGAEMHKKLGEQAAIKVLDLFLKSEEGEE